MWYFFVFSNLHNIIISAHLPIQYTRYIITFIVYTRTWKNIYGCMWASVYDHVISRHASRGGGNYLISSGIIFFFPAAEHKSKLWNYRISVGLPKKGVPETIACTSVIVSPNNHHNNRPGRRGVSAVSVCIELKNETKLFIKNRFTLLHACAQRRIRTYAPRCCCCCCCCCCTSLKYNM